MTNENIRDIHLTRQQIMFHIIHGLKLGYPPQLFTKTNGISPIQCPILMSHLHNMWSLIFLQLHWTLVTFSTLLTVRNDSATSRKKENTLFPDSEASVLSTSNFKNGYSWRTNKMTLEFHRKEETFPAFCLNIATSWISDVQRWVRFSASDREDQGND